MEKRYFKSIGEKISLLGFGCMRLPKLYDDKQDIDEILAQKMIDYAIENGINYFDTAYPYHEGMSETFIGKALKKYPRESFHLTTKMPVWLVQNEDDTERIFNEQLEKCQVDYFDFYLMHNLNEEHFENAEKHHVYDFLKQKKAEGKIRHLGFSFHDSVELLESIVKTHKWDFAQIQLNYLDWDLQNAKRQYEILSENNLPVIVMEPVRGGALATLSESAIAILKSENPDASPASWAIRYAASFPNVLTVLSGMSNFEQVKDNIQTISDFEPLSEKEREVLQKALTAYRASGTIPCTGCRYCMDCPAGVDIPKVFSAYNQYCISKNANVLKITYQILGEEKQEHHCVNCKKCVPKCPQKIDIPKHMIEIKETISKL